MKEFTTKYGFKFTLSQDILDDWELVELMEDIDTDAGMYKVPKVLKKILGTKSYKALKEYHRGEDGRVKASDMMEELSAIFDAINDSEESPEKN